MPKAGKSSIFAKTEKCHSKCDRKTAKSIFLVCQGFTKEGRVLLRSLKTETERRFRAVSARLRRTRRRRRFRKSPWYKGFCGQKESRHSDGCLTIAGNGRGEAEERPAQPDAIAPQMPRIWRGDEGKTSAFLPHCGKRKAEVLDELRRTVKLVAEMSLF